MGKTREEKNREASRARLKALWADPTYREKMAAKKAEKAKAQNAAMTPEQRSERGQKAIAVRWADRQTPPENAEELIYKAAENGCTKTEIAKVLGVGIDKLNDWLNSTEHGLRLTAAMTRGREVEHDRLIQLLFQAAIEGKIKGSIVAILFLLKTRHGYREGDALVQNSVSINYQLPAPLSSDDYMKMVAPGAGEKQMVPAREVKKLAAEVTRE